MLVYSPSEVGMVTPSEGCVNVMFFGDIFLHWNYTWRVCSCDALVCAWI